MKILYIANERRAAQLAAQALRGIAPNVTLTWAQTLSSALHWVQGNRDAAAVIVEAEVQGRACSSFVGHVRGLGLTTPLVVVAPEHLRAPLAALMTGANDYVVDGQSLQADLPQIVTGALQRTRTAAATSHSEARHQATSDRERIDREVLEAKLAENEASRLDAEQRLARAEQARQQAEHRASVERAAAAREEAARRTELEERLAQETAQRTTLEQNLARAETARQQAEQRCASGQAAEAARLAEVQAQHDGSLARTARICTALQQRLLELEAALRETEQQRATESAASIHHLAQRHAEFTASLTQAARSRDALAQQLSAAAAALDEARQARTAEAAAAAEHLTRREAELGAMLTEAVAARTQSEQELAQATSALQQAGERATAERAAAERAAAGRQAKLEERLAREVNARITVERSLAQAQAALDDSVQKRTSEAAAAVERLNQREAELASALSEAAATRSAFELALAEAETAHQHARQRAAADLANAAGRQAELEERLTREATARITLEQKLADADAAQRDAERRHASELAAAAARLADVEALHDATVAQTAAARTAFEQQLTDAVAALDASHRKRASEAAAAVERLNQREAELGSALAEAAAARSALEHALAEAETAHQHAHQRAEGDLAAAAERHTEFEAQLAQGAAARTTLERDLTEMRMESARARRRLLQVASAIRRRTREHRAQLGAQHDRERAGYERALEAKEEEIGRLLLDGETLRQSLAGSREQLQRLNDTLSDERQTYEHARLASESDRQRLSEEYEQALQTLNQVRAAFSTLEHVSSEHARERARLETVVADRDAQLSTQAARHLASEQAAKDALEQLQERSRLALEASSRDLARLQRELGALRQELEDTRAHVEALRGEAGRVPDLQRQLDDSQAENRRQFERAPYAMCRCNPNGAITHANRSLVKLLGYRTGDELRKLEFAATVFESPGDLRWLIERSVNTATTESLETTWKTRDGGRVVVRLQALVTTNGSVEIVAEDITSLRAVEERLRHAQRLEAVGRLASEVAVTCDTLLRDVTRDGEQWLAAIESNSALRHRGELLLGEVTRAASFLRQFAVYGNKQVSALEPASVQRVLRDLEPVLKRVAGDDIELVLPKTTAPMDVDVEAERVERVLVNVASYARERMPGGGRVKIDLATTVVGRKFVAKYPNVRPGAHVVITVSEVRGRGRLDVPAELRTKPAAAAVSRSPSDKPGVDLGALLRLISDCGGHLWITAEPPGNMTLKIHLPKRAPAAAVDPGAPARPPRGRSLARLFRH